jgi:hypothetical protein
MDVDATTPFHQLYHMCCTYLQRMTNGTTWSARASDDGTGAASPFTLRWGHFQGKSCANPTCKNKKTCTGCILPLADVTTTSDGAMLKDNMNVCDRSFARPICSMIKCSFCYIFDIYRLCLISHMVKENSIVRVKYTMLHIINHRQTY